MKTKALIQKDTCTPMFAAAQPRHGSDLSVHEQTGKNDVVHTPDETLLSHKPGWTLARCDKTDGPRGYCAKRSKSEKQVLYKVTFTWTLKDKTNESTQLKETHRYQEQIGGCQGGVERKETGEGY